MHSPGKWFVVVFLLVFWVDFNRSVAQQEVVCDRAFDVHPPIPLQHQGLTYVESIRLESRAGEVDRILLLLPVEEDNSQSIVELRGDGKGALEVFEVFRTEAASYPRAILGILAGDIDGDGLGDLLLQRSPRSFDLVTGTSDGRFVAGPSHLLKPAESAESPVLGDFDGDGKAELSYSARRRIYVAGYSSLGWSRRVIGDAPEAAKEPLVADLDGDGVDERLYYHKRDPKQLDVLEMGPSGPLSRRQRFVLPRKTAQPKIIDVDGDGRDEVLFFEIGPANMPYVYWLGRRNGSAIEVVWERDLPYRWAPHHILDMDMDGDDDIVAGMGSRETWAYRVLANQQADPPSDGTRIHGFLVLVGLVHADDDDRPDLVLYDSRHEGFVVHKGKRDGSFDDGFTYQRVARAGKLFGGDINGDGTADLISFPSGLWRGEDVVDIYLGEGGRRFAEARVIDSPGPADFSKITLLDIDRDGNLDLLVGGAMTRNRIFSIGYGIGDGSFAPWIDHDMGGEIRSSVFGDFDGDGDHDLAVYTFAAKGELELFRIEGRTWTPTDSKAFGGKPYLSMHAADFEGGGAKDLVRFTDFDDPLQEILRERLISLRFDETLPLWEEAEGRTISPQLSADLDGNGLDELVISTRIGPSERQLETLIWTGGPPLVSVWKGGPWNPTHTVDLDRDGLIDLLDGPRFRVMRGRGDGSFEDSTEPYWANGPGYADALLLGPSHRPPRVVRTLGELQDAFLGVMELSEKRADDDRSPPDVGVRTLPIVERSNGVATFDNRWRIAAVVTDECDSSPTLEQLSLQWNPSLTLAIVSNYRYGDQMAFHVYRDPSGTEADHAVLIGPDEAAVRFRWREVVESGLIALERGDIVALIADEEWGAGPRLFGDEDMLPPPTDLRLIERFVFEDGKLVRAVRRYPGSDLSVSARGRDRSGKIGEATISFNEEFERYCADPAAEAIICSSP